MHRENCQAVWPGTLPFETAWRMQEKLAGEIACGERPATLLLLEHPHTFTAGVAAKAGHLLWDKEERERNGAAFFEVDRGGDVTHRGPGHLVGYPLFQLKSMNKNQEDPPGADVVGFVRKIESALITALANLGIEGRRRQGFSGVWIEEQTRKRGESGLVLKRIASIGLKLDVNRVSRHGFALNVDPDMRYWSGIIACGLEGVLMTSMAACLGRLSAMKEVVKAVYSSFETVFGFQVVFSHSF